MKNSIVLFVALISVTSIKAQEIENAKYSFKSGERARIVEITDDVIKISRRNSFNEEYNITERREIEGIKQIICNIGEGKKVVISQTMNGKNLFMYKWENSNKPIDNLEYWYVKYRSSNKLKKITLTQTKRNW